MKKSLQNKFLFSTICMLTFFRIHAQIVNETVSLGAGYANQTWYSLENDEQGSSPKNNWDLAFDLSGYGTSIHINSVIGTKIWTYPAGNISVWNTTLDTTNISTWTSNYNSDTTWSIGAFDKGINSNNPFDIGWGIYNTTTHIITGDSLFIIKLSSGAYKKLWIKDLTNGTYNFEYADLDGTNNEVGALIKSNFQGKNFGYYSLQTNESLNREPVASTEWDLLFTQHTAFIPTAYTVAGVLSNKGVTVAKVVGVNDVTAFVDYSSQTFETAINEIGYNWKAYAGAWVIEDSLVYFVNSKSGDIWKLVFTGFGGSSTGNYDFTKQKLHSASIFDLNNEKIAQFSIFPNPAKEKVSILFNSEKQNTAVVLKINDLSGREVYSNEFHSTNGLTNFTFDSSSLNAGIYVVGLEFEGQKIEQKLIIQ